MCHHGVMVIGHSVADAFNRLSTLSCREHIKALWTGQPLKVLPDEIAEKTARELEAYGQAERRAGHLMILDAG